MINLLPEQEKKMMQRIRLFRLINACLVGVAVLMVVGALLSIPTFVTVANRYELAQAQVSSLIESEKMVSDVDTAALEASLAEVSKKLAPSASDALVQQVSEIRALAKSPLTLTRITVTDPYTIDLYGTAPSRENLQGFAGALSAVGGVDRVDSPLSNLVKTKDGAFKLTVLLVQKK